MHTERLEICSIRYRQIRLLYRCFFFFFFSSRRRHTRYWRDWSSDVCSSDLAPPPGARGGTRYEIFHDVLAVAILDWRARHEQARGVREADERARRERRKARRSEERRVGKECRSRWSPYH